MTNAVPRKTKARRLPLWMQFSLKVASPITSDQTLSTTDGRQIRSNTLETGPNNVFDKTILNVKNRVMS